MLPARLKPFGRGYLMWRPCRNHARPAEAIRTGLPDCVIQAGSRRGWIWRLFRHQACPAEAVRTGLPDCVIRAGRRHGWILDTGGREGWVVPYSLL
jgi:hypothetical protein